MFERLIAHAKHRAEEKAEARAREIAARIARDAPPGMGVDAVASGVGLTGEGLIRRHVAEPALRRSVTGSWR